ncbi:hypothetical protein HBA55_18025 [Pseudomaricurvus alkylphenolicus]|uniref:hypothetical protein n=1 Tax=Pseudomaricurvus alkylphenolicus TaxID=1306991 RepID=UPI00141EDEB3|nr:hypothetical protein [Pseudomaricurvus alkylphenolicus]NIB41506.1 hypothetical protein [Pseudomaricurvus alkylphenolicus]
MTLSSHCRGLPDLAGDVSKVIQEKHLTVSSLRAVAIEFAQMPQLLISIEH